MTLSDVNLLLYAYDASSAHHERARRWLEERLSGVETVAFASIVLLAFVRLVTSPRVFESPLEVDEAFDVVDSWLAAPCSTVVHPGSRHPLALRQLLEPLGTGGNLATTRISRHSRWSTTPSSAPPTRTSRASQGFAGRIRSSRKLTP